MANMMAALPHAQYAAPRRCRCAATPSSSTSTETPLCDALLRHDHHQRTALHVPGHKRGAGASPMLQRVVGSTALSHDLTELTGLDILSTPTSCIAVAQEHAARVFGAQQTWFLVNGSTVGIHAALMATAHRGDFVIVARNCHIAAYAGLTLSGGHPLYVGPSVDPLLGCAHAVHAEAVQAALHNASAAGHRVAAVLLVSPTYFGVLSDVAAVARIAHAHGVPLIVDEAHGAHLGRHPSLPQSAIQAGADVVVQSTHKLLGALTQASMLHCAQGSLVDPARLSSALSTLQSSSPSYLLMASLDAAAAQVADARVLHKPLQAVEAARARLQGVRGVAVLDEQGVHARCGPGACHAMDPLRLTIGVDQAVVGMDGFGLQAALEERCGVVTEMATETVVVCAFGIGSTIADGHALADAVLDVCSRGNTVGCTASPPAPLPKALPPVAMTPRAAFFAPTRRVLWADAAGLVAAELVSVYPPGIPLLVPGERVTAAVLEAWGASLTGRLRVSGVSDTSLETMLVVDDSGTL